MAEKTAGAVVPPSYLALIERFPLRPIRTEAENEEALRVVEDLGFGRAGRPLDEHEEDYLDVLCMLIEGFERAHYRLAYETTPEDLLRGFIEDRGLTQAEAAAEMGVSAPRLSELLNGKRRMGRELIGRAARAFKVDPGIFYECLDGKEGRGKRAEGRGQMTDGK